MVDPVSIEVFRHFLETSHPPAVTAVSYTHLNLLTDEIIEFVSRSRSFMPHFHIPLQSGSDEVLKLMRRRYDTALFASKVRKIKEVMPDA